MEVAIEKSAMRKVYMRLLPFAMLSYILAYIDRINVSFAGLTMRDDLGLSATDYGFALGTFFLGYFIFEVPSNVVMEKVGARIWIARIMITWGIFAGLMAFVFDVTSFAVVRFLLGVAEAGFFPGMLLYFTYWFPRKHHARIVSSFLAGLPIAVAIGAPISAYLLSLDGMFGLKGWQIMYIAEAIPTIFIGLLTLIVLTDRPEQAKFLNAEEKAWLTARLNTERQVTGEPVTHNMWRALRDPKVLMLTLMYLAITLVSLAMLYYQTVYSPPVTAWLNTIIPGIHKDLAKMLIVLIPYVIGLVGMLIWSRVADKDLWNAMINGKVLLMAINYFGIVTASLGLLYFIPQIIKASGGGPAVMSSILTPIANLFGSRGPVAITENLAAVLLTMIPYTFGGIAMVTWGRVSDRMNERRWNLLGACVLAAAGLVFAGYSVTPAGKALFGAPGLLIGMSLATMGFYGSKGPFFAMPAMFLRGTALAGAFAWINSIGNLGGTVGPYYVGYMKDQTGDFSGGLYGLALLCLISAIVCALFLHIPDPEKTAAEIAEDKAGRQAA